MCLTPECKNTDILSRGLCKKCYDRLRKRVARGTARWHDLISQGLAKQAVRSGPLLEVRRDAQKHRKQTRGNPHGLTPIMWKAAIESAKKKLEHPEQLTEEDRLFQCGILSLAGELPNDPTGS